jgi:hypothetical protein
MTDNEPLDLLEQYLAEAKEQATILRDLMAKAKNNMEGFTKEAIEEMTRHQQAWSAIMEKHNALAQELYGKK